MLAYAAILVAIYAVWIVTLVNAMVSSEEVSLTIATIPFIITFPIALILAALLEVAIPGSFMIDVTVTIITGVIIFVRWVMAIAGE